MKTTLFLFCSLLVVSCYYEPDGEFTANPVPISLDGVVINLQDITDTLFVHDYVQIQYEVTNFPPDVPMVGVKAYLNEIQIYQNFYSSGNIVIDPYQRGSGVFQCKVEYLSSSGSGSLADKAGKEFVSSSKEFVVVIDIEYPQPAVISSIDHDNGKVNIHWDKCTKRNFGSYTVVKYCADYYQNFQPCGFVEITDANITTWTDEDFVAGSVAYQINTLANSRHSTGNSTRYDFFPQSDFTLLDKKAILRWDKPRHFANTKAVTLTNYGTDPFESVPVTDTVFETSVLPDFGTVAQFIKVTFESQKPERSYSFNVPYYIGTQHDYPAIKPAYYSPASDHFYGNVSGGLLALDHAFNGLSDNVVPAELFAISADGQFLVGHSVNDPARPLHQLNLETVIPDASLSLTSIFGHENLATIYSNLSVGNNGFVALSTVGGSKIYKLPLFDEVFSGPETYLPFVISTSGNYAYLEGEILKFNGTTFQKIRDLPADPGRVLWDKDDNLIFIASGSMTIIEPETGSIIREVDLPLINYYYHVRYDPHSHLLLWGQDQDYCLVDLSNGDKRIFKGYYNVTIVRGKLFVLNDYKFYSIDPQFYFEP